MPAPRQRLIVIAACVVAGLCYGAMADAINAGNGAGSSVLEAAAPGGALVAMAAWSVPAMVAALVAGAAGNPLAAFAVLAAGMLVPAWQGGPIDDWLRAIDSPSAYRVLAIESGIWALPFLAVALVNRMARDRVRSMLPGFVRSAHCAEVPDDDPTLDRSALNSAAMNGGIAIAVLVVIVLAAHPTAGAISVLVDFVVVTVIALAMMVAAWAATYGIIGRFDRIEQARHRQRIGPHLAPAFWAGAMTVVVGTAGVFILLRSPEPGQAVGAVLVSFTVGGFLAHQAFPTPVRLTFILAPLMVGAAGYVYTSFAVSGAVELLETFFASRDGWLPATATTMPATFASAGVLGATLGVGWSQGVFAAKERHVALAT